MDKRKLLLLKYLLNHSDDGYVVLETKKIMNSLKKYKNDFLLFEKDMYFLKSRKYLDLKYIDEENLCFSILDNSRILQENLKLEKSLQSKFFNLSILTMIISGLMAFLGAFVALILFR